MATIQQQQNFPPTFDGTAVAVPPPPGRNPYARRGMPVPPMPPLPGGPTIAASGLADPVVPGGGTAEDASPTTMVLNYLKSRGFQPTSENVRRALEANARDPGVIPGLRSDTGATEAQDQAAMRAAGAGGGRRGGGGGRTTSAAPTSNVDDSFFPAAPQARPAASSAASNDTFFPDQRPAAPPPPANPDTFFPGAPNTSASLPPRPGQPPAVVAPTASSGVPLTATQMYGGTDTSGSPTVAANPPPAPAIANPSAPYSGPTPMGDVKAIGDMISNGINLPAVSGFLQRTFAQRPPTATPPPPAEPAGPPTPPPVPWVIQALEDQNRRSNLNPAPGVPTVLSPQQMYGGVPEPNAPLPPPANPADPTRPMRQQPIPVIRPSVMLSRSPSPLNTALERALEERRNQAVGDTQTRGATVATR